MAPSVTEVLYAIGAGDQIVGVTRYCYYPPEVENKTRIGGYYDPDYEKLLSLQPDLVVLLPEHEAVRGYLEKLHLPYLTVNHRNIAGILESIEILGKQTGCVPRAEALSKNIRERLDALRTHLKNLPPKNVLVSVGRELGTGGLQTVFAAGGGSFHGELIELAGGKNVCEKFKNYPILAREGLLQVNPEVILDLIPDAAEKKMDDASLLKEWGTFPELRAVATHQVFIFRENFTVIPGPRFVDIIEKMACVLHPEVFETTA